MDTAVDDPGTTGPGTLSELVADQGVPGVDADTDDVTWLELRIVERRDHLVTQDGVAPFVGRGGSQHIEPARSDHGHPEGKVARVDNVDVHTQFLPWRGLLAATEDPCESGTQNLKCRGCSLSGLGRTLTYSLADPRHLGPRTVRVVVRCCRFCVQSECSSCGQRNWGPSVDPKLI